MKKEKEMKEMTKLEELWNETFGLRKNLGSMELKSIDGQVIKLTYDYGDWKLAITDPMTGNTERFSDQADIGSCHAKGDFFCCVVHRRHTTSEGEITFNCERIEIKVVL